MSSDIGEWLTVEHMWHSRVVEANSWEEIGRIVSPLNQVFKMDVKVGPAISLEEFGQAVQIAGESAKDFVPSQ